MRLADWEKERWDLNINININTSNNTDNNTNININNEWQLENQKTSELN